MIASGTGNGFKTIKSYYSSAPCPMLQSEFLFIGENLVSKSQSQSQTFTRSGAGKAEDGVPIAALPPSSVSTSRVAGIFCPRRSSPSVAIRGTTPHGTDWPDSPTTAATSYVAARCHAFTQSAYVLKSPRGIYVCVCIVIDCNIIYLSKILQWEKISIGTTETLLTYVCHK